MKVPAEMKPCGEVNISVALEEVFRWPECGGEAIQCLKGWESYIQFRESIIFALLAEPRCRPGDDFGGEGSPCCSRDKRCSVGEGVCRSEGDCEEGLVCGRNRASRTCIARLGKEHQDDSCCTYKGAVSISMPVLFHVVVKNNCLSLYFFSMFYLHCELFHF